MKINVYNIQAYSIFFYIVAMIVGRNTGVFIVQIARVLVVGILSYSFLFKERYFVRKSNDMFYVYWNIIFGIYCFVGIFIALSPDTAKTFWLTLIYVVIVNVLIYIYLIDRPYLIETLLNAVIIGATLKSALIYITEGLFVFLNSRTTSSGTSANSYGFACAIACVFCIYKYIKNKKSSRARLFYMFVFILNFLFMLLSASRKSFIFIGVPLVVVYIFKNMSSIKILGRVLISIVVVIIGYVIIIEVDFLYELIGNRLQSMIGGLFRGTELDGSTRTRLYLIEEGMKWFKNKPFFGYGLHNFVVLFSAENPKWTPYYAHNNYVELLVDCGIIGTIIYYLMHIKIILFSIVNIAKYNLLNIIFYGLILAITIADYAMVSYNVPLTQLLILISCVLLNSHKQEIKREHKKV